jgi:hypothetical protein
MESNHPEPEINEATTTQPEDSTPDPAALVQRLIEAGDWPDPALVEQIAAAGEAALGPLLDFMRTYPDPKDYDREIALYNGIIILGAIRSPTAIPVLVEIIRRYPEESGELAAEVLGDFGAVAFESTLELIRDPDIKGYPRQHVIEAAQRAVGTDPILRARLAEALRSLLADAMEQARAEASSETRVPDEDEDDEAEGSGRWTLKDLDDEESIEDEEEGDLARKDEPSPEAVASSTDREGPYASSTPEMYPSEEVAFLVSDLTDQADPQARDLIKTAFEEDLVDQMIIDEECVEEIYREGGGTLRPEHDWLKDYRERYREHMEYKNRPRTAPQSHTDFSRPSSYREPPYEPPPPQPPETIRNTGPKLGRNDPCWCGSGKKYKKCHWGKDDLK